MLVRWASMILTGVLPALLLGQRPAPTNQPWQRPPAVMAEGNYHQRNGDAALRKGLQETARKSFLRAQELLPETPGPYRGLCWVALGQGNTESALRLWTQYLEHLKEAHERYPRLVSGRPEPRLDAAIRPFLQPGDSKDDAPGGTRAKLVVTTEPAGAEVLLNGTASGISPVTLEGVEKGRHLVRVSLKGFSPAQQEVSIEPGGVAIAPFQLRRTTQLNISTRPTGAQVVLDGTVRGETPLTVAELEDGAHRLELRSKASPQPWVTSLALEPGQIANLTVPLLPAGGQLSVATDPPGAAVTLDEMLVGYTPLGPNLVEPGSHWLTVARPGHTVDQRLVTVAAASPLSLTFALRPVRLDLEVEGLPGGARFYVDGEPWEVKEGRASDLSPGEHELMATREGYLPWGTRIQLFPGGDNRVQVHLAREEGKKDRMGWAVGSGILAAAALGGAVWVGKDGSGMSDWVLAGGLAALGGAAGWFAYTNYSHEQPPQPGAGDLPDVNTALPPPPANPTWGLRFSGRF